MERLKILKTGCRASYLIIAAAAVGLCSLPTDTKANVVTDWNARAVQYSSAAGRPGPSSVVDIAVAQAAVYDAVQAIEGDYQPYCGSILGASGSTVAAAAKAARDVLVYRFPAQAATINADYNAYVAGIDPADPGFAVGQAAAQCMISLRANDGAFPNPPWPPYSGPTNPGPGEWRSTPPANAPFAAEWLGFVTPFTMRSSDQFRSGPAPRLNSPEYTKVYNEVRDYGSATGSLRTPDETDMAWFWSGNFAVQLNKLTRDLSIAHGLSDSESSRVFALTALAMADGIIAAWDCKREYIFWRPITAIRLGNTDGNPRTEGVSDWEPLIVNTPPYPDHTSGANAIAASAVRALSLFFGTNEMNFEISSGNPTRTQLDTRSYSKFSEVRDEVVEARIFLGIHFRFADVDARKQGEHIAQWAHSHYFRPAGELLRPEPFDSEKFVVYGR